MVKLTRITTGGGDKGRTSLGDGTRVAKHDPRVAAFGAVDEANSLIGIVRLHCSGEADAMLARIQNDLFDLGADLCTPEGAIPRKNRLRMSTEQITRLESECAELNKDLPALSSFILPGGSAAAAHLHHARTAVRGAERLMTKLAQDEEVNEAALRYVNRLSDHLFVLARALNDRGKGDVLWVPGKNR